MSALRPRGEETSIYRVVHRENLPWVLDNGLHCVNSPVRDPRYVGIGKEDLIARRRVREVPIAPGGTLGDYVPFYFTPFSPMLYNIVTGRGVMHRRDEDLLVLASRLRRVSDAGVPFLFTDAHAYSRLANYHSNIDELDAIDWVVLGNRDFRRDPEDPEKLDRYQAEALVYRHLPVGALIGIICCTDVVGSRVREALAVRALAIEVSVRGRGYFS